MDEFADLDEAALRRALTRERQARREAEDIAENSIRRLYDSNVELDRRVEDRTRELDVLRQREAEASGAKSRFLANLSHEVRTPLNGIVGMLELLDGVDMEPDHARWVDSAHDAAGRLDHLFVRLLRFVDLESGLDRPRSSEPVTASLQTVVSRTAERWRLRCARAGQLLTVDVDPEADFAIVDPAEVGKTLDELLSNATMHADPGAVELSATVYDDEVELAVVDSGPGYEVDLATLEIMQPRSEVSQRADVGAGLGLPLVARAVEFLDGTWGVNATDGRTRAWIRLPRVRPSTSE